MLQPKTETQFAIARDGELISDGYPDVETAQRQLAHVGDTMKSVGLEPDVDIVTVEVKTSIGKPKLWVDPRPAINFDEHVSIKGEGASLTEATDKLVDAATTAPAAD